MSSSRRGDGAREDARATGTTTSGAAPRDGTRAPRYVPPDPRDRRHGGAKRVLEAELEHVRAHRAEYGRDSGGPPDDSGKLPDDLVGLAISGGGIRSASFALGVMQTLAKHGWMERFDYLSTVSGGGYIGASLTWLLNRGPFRASADGFPYGTDPHRDDGGDAASERQPSQVLDWLRQHGNYLAPGDGLNLPTFVAVCLRAISLSVLVYFGLMVLVLWTVIRLGSVSCDVWTGPCRVEALGASLLGAPAAASSVHRIPLLLVLAGCVIVALLLAAVCYSVGTFLARRFRPVNWYRVRRTAEMWAGRGLVLAIALLVLSSVGPVYDWFAATLRCWIDGGGGLVGAVSSVLGALSTLGVFRSRGSGDPPRVPPGLLASIGATLLVYGLLLLAHHTAVLIDQPPYHWVALLGACTIALGWFTNVNYVSIHRFYRDRLMETFMPDLPVGESRLAAGADETALHALRSPVAPYHLVNTNVVLVESPHPRYRGRGGDAFVLAPRYCGSSATGWCATGPYMNGNMKLSTAMAISGAAANPHTGVGGSGATRSYLLSFLMAFLNVRLGYWAPNPDIYDDDPEQRFRARRLWKFPPNFLYPGLWELLNFKKLSERSFYLELTDGGHFENLAIYELIRRRCRVIVVTDGGADPGFAFGDLSNAIERVRTDFGVEIALGRDDLACLLPGRDDEAWSASREQPRPVPAKRGYVVAPIRYPEPGEPEGRLVFVKTTFVEQLTADLYGYKLESPAFPDESTADQFFSEKQFEAYRELGRQLADAMITDPSRDPGALRHPDNGPFIEQFLPLPAPRSGP